MIKIILAILAFFKLRKEVVVEEFKSKYFALEDFTKSETAEEFNIDNTPNDEQLENIQWLCNKILDPLRYKLDKEIKITSGFRSLELNNHKKVKGSKTSHHLFGKAADIRAEGISATELFNYILEETSLPFDQVILEFPKSNNGGWVHISYDRDKTKQRGLKMIANLVNGKVKYTYL